uniref:Uncharacterized protein n=2 Tax=environmental samples TaxID=651140 RepID=A0A075G3D1_9ARCH|nr:hypothetical protein [uncultured marine thaumarchaeote KM3_06_A04]AIE98560.1 hypothetical protein [uncultured marine thaumarchaeote KM3_06_B06]
MLCVVKFIIVFLSVIFLTLIGYTTQSVIADHTIPGDGIYKDFGDVNLITTAKDSKYQINLQLILRTNDGQLINVTESTANAAYIPHQITDHVFDTLMGEKEIVTINNIKYEKVQYTYTPTLEHRFMGLYPIFSERYDLEFKSTPAAREAMDKHKDFSMWKIHYCATFEGHGFSCVPVFQDLVPTMTLEPHDVATHQWTVLRILN